jgi:hypothetical protein
VLGIIGFYFYDAFMLLNINELILTRSTRHWSYKFPLLDFQLLRKYPLLPNPLTPNVVLFRTFWPGNDQHLNPKELDVFTKSLLPVQIIVVLLLLLMLVCLPAVAFVYGSGVNLLIIFSLIYLVIVSILIYVLTQKDNLYLTKAKFISIAFESIACPPFALNIVRKITLNHPLLGDPYVFSKKVFDSNTQLSFTRDLGYAIEENLKFLETGSNRYIELKEYLCLVRGEG